MLFEIPDPSWKGEQIYSSTPSSSPNFLSL